jgi:hypothetical protein
MVTMTTTTIGVHAATARMDIHEVVRQLNVHLGPTLVAALAGTPDRKLPIRWAKADGPTPGSAYQRRLQVAHRLWTLIANAESDHVARSWFIAANPMLEEDTPLTAIREDRSKAVVAAAAAFVEDQPAT